MSVNGGWSGRCYYEIKKCCQLIIIIKIIITQIIIKEQYKKKKKKEERINGALEDEGNRKINKVYGPATTVSQTRGQSNPRGKYSFPATARRLRLLTDPWAVAGRERLPTDMKWGGNRRLWPSRKWKALSLIGSFLICVRMGFVRLPRRPTREEKKPGQMRTHTI